MSVLNFMLSERQQRLLASLLLRPEKELSLTDLLEVGGAGHGGTQRFIQKLVESKLVHVNIHKKQRRYQANTSHPIYAELTSICRKTFGIRDIVATALEPFHNLIEQAFIFGSVARGDEGPNSDVDVMVIGVVRPSQIVSVERALEEQLGRPVHFNFYDPQEWADLIEADPIISEISKGPRIDLLRTEHVR